MARWRRSVIPVGVVWLGGLVGGCAAPAPGPPSRIAQVWFDTRTARGTDPEWLVAHAELAIVENEPQQCSLTVRFRDAAGRPMRSTDGSYRLQPEGQVGAMRTFLASGDPASSRQELAVPIPFAELELPPGDHRLSAELEVRSLRAGRTLTRVHTDLELRTDGKRGQVLRPAGPIEPQAVASAPSPSSDAAPGPVPVAAAQTAPTRAEPGVYWFLRRDDPHGREHDRLLGPVGARRAAEARRRGPRDRVVALTGRDPVWVFQTVDPETGRRIRLLGPFATFRAAEQARRRLQRAPTETEQHVSPVRQWTVRRYAGASAP